MQIVDKFLRLLMVSVGSILAVFPNIARAGSVLPDVTYGGPTNIGGKPFTGLPINLAGITQLGGAWSLSASSSLDPVPALTMSGSVSDDSQGVGGDIYMIYAFEVCQLSGCGTPSDTTVGVGFKAYGTVNVTGNPDLNESQVYLTIGDVAMGNNILIAGDAGGQLGSWTLNTNLQNVDLNTVYYVSMHVQGDAVGGAFFGQIDPMFTVDPSLYKLDFSQGVVNGDPALATPLPASLPLFATGFGALGLLGLRTKRKAATA